MGRLEGKRAFLTAAAQGIGRATAIAFAREGAEVIATDVSEEKLAGLTDEGIARVAALDVLSTSAVNEMAAEVGGIDILFNCAGFVHAGTVLECSEKDWDFSFDLNVKSMHRTIKAFIPGMVERGMKSPGGSSIINISSGASSFKAAANRYVYGASKAAVIGLTRAVALDFIRQGVRCNTIAPGTVFSPSWEERAEVLGEKMGSKEAAVKMFTERQPMGRLGTAEEIAMAAVYLASDEASFTTGIIMSVDGGWQV